MWERTNDGIWNIKKEKHVRADKFVKEMKERHKEAKTVLSKSQKEMKRHANTNLKDLMEY